MSFAAAWALSGYSHSTQRRVHRCIARALLFVCAMLTMAVTGLLVSCVRRRWRRPSTSRRRFDVLSRGHLFDDCPSCRLGIHSLSIEQSCCWAGRRLRLLRARDKGDWPGEAGLAYPLFLFGGVALGGAEGDRRTMRCGGLARHRPVEAASRRMCLRCSWPRSRLSRTQPLPEMLRTLFFAASACSCRSGHVLLAVALRGRRAARPARCRPFRGGVSHANHSAHPHRGRPCSPWRRLRRALCREGLDAPSQERHALRLCNGHDVTHGRVGRGPCTTRRRRCLPFADVLFRDHRMRTVRRRSPEAHWIDTVAWSMR